MEDRKWIGIKELCKEIGGENFTGGILGMYHLNNEFLVSGQELVDMREDFNDYINKLDQKDKVLKMTSKNRFLSPLLQTLLSEGRVRPKPTNSIKFIMGE